MPVMLMSDDYDRWLGPTTPISKAAEIDEFCQACRAGKAETDDLVERSTVQHITGYYVTVDEMDRFGNGSRCASGYRAMPMQA